jgi:hypothetical protein
MAIANRSNGRPAELWLLTALLGSPALGATAQGQQGPALRNVILILSDDHQ